MSAVGPQDRAGRRTDVVAPFWTVLATQAVVTGTSRVTVADPAASQPDMLRATLEPPRLTAAG